MIMDDWTDKALREARESIVKARRTAWERRERQIKQLAELDNEVLASGNEIGVIDLILEQFEAELSARASRQEQEARGG